MNVKDFINQVFLTEYKKLIDSRSHYISFALIAVGIEFLGACLDANDFDKRGLSTTRFTKAIQDLFPSQYHPHASQLCADLRNGFAHQFRPGFRFALTHREESAREGTSHFGPFGKQTVLIAEDLYEDFEHACREVITRIDNGKLNHPKLSRSFLKISVPAAATNPLEITEKIRQRAYELYDTRGRQDGHALDDWLRAEVEIIGTTA